MNRTIKSIEKGYGQDSTFFSTDNNVYKYSKVDEIKEETKVIGAGYYNDLTITVYGIYKNGERIAEIEANSAITLRFETKNDTTDEQ